MPNGGAHASSTPLSSKVTLALQSNCYKTTENSGARLSWLEKLFRDHLQSIQSAHQFKRDAVTISGRLKQALHKTEELQEKLFCKHGNIIIKPESEFINFISNTFNLIEDEYKLQCTGIDKRVFEEFETSLVEYLKLGVCHLCDE